MIVSAKVTSHHNKQRELTAKGWGLLQHLKVFNAAGAAGKHGRDERAEEHPEQALVCLIWLAPLQNLHMESAYFKCKFPPCHSTFNVSIGCVR